MAYGTRRFNATFTRALSIIPILNRINPIPIDAYFFNIQSNIVLLGLPRGLFPVQLIRSCLTIQLRPQVICVEELEGLDRLEVVHMLLGHLRDLKQPQLVLVLDQRATLENTS